MRVIQPLTEVYSFSENIFNKNKYATIIDTPANSLTEACFPFKLYIFECV